MPDVSEYLYRLSLEEPGRWCMFIGSALEPEPPHLDIGALDAFVRGYQEAGTSPPTDFFRWLRDEAHAFPPEGWARALLVRNGGDHRAAIAELFGYVHRFALETRPAWFIAFNQVPRPSQVVDGEGLAVQADIRIPLHVAAVGGHRMK